MKGIIQESAIRWKGNNPYKHTEMVESIVKAIDYWRIKNERGNLTTSKEN